MALVLHAGNTNKNAFKALIAAEYSGVQVELVNNFEMGVSNKTPEFLKMNPIGKVPVLETPDGPVFESNTIARYGPYRAMDRFLINGDRCQYFAMVHPLCWFCCVPSSGGGSSHICIVEGTRCFEHTSCFQHIPCWTLCDIG